MKWPGDGVAHTAYMKDGILHVVADRMTPEAENHERWLTRQREAATDALVAQRTTEVLAATLDATDALTTATDRLETAMKIAGMGTDAEAR